MTQNRESGAQANQFGRELATKIMKLLGAERVKSGSNECILEGRVVSIHSARKATDSVGVTKLCLERLTSVVAAFEQEDGSFLLLELSADEFRKNARPTRSRGPSAGRVVLVSRTVFDKYGKRLMKVAADLL